MITWIKQRFGHRASKRDFYRPLQGGIIRADTTAKHIATGDVAAAVMCGQNRGKLNLYPQTIGYDGMPRLVVRFAFSSHHCQGSAEVFAFPQDEGNDV